MDEILNGSRDNTNSIDNSYTRSYKDDHNHNLITDIKGNVLFVQKM